MFIFTYSGYSFIHSSKFFESPQFSHLFSFCTKTSPDHVTVTSHPKWRLIVNFLKNSHSFSEYSIFTYSFAPGSQDFCTSVIPSSKDYSSSLRQHHCLCLHKQTRGHPLLGPVCPDLASVCLLSQEQGCSYSKTCSRGHESCGRPTLQVSTDPSYRVVPQSQDLQVTVTNRLPTSNRSFCNKIQSQASPVCFSSARSQGSGSRCPGDELVRTSSLLLPSYSSLSTCGQEVNQLSELQDASCGPSLGNQRVASRHGKPKSGFKIYWHCQ